MVSVPYCTDRSLTYRFRRIKLRITLFAKSVNRTLTFSGFRLKSLKHDHITVPETNRNGLAYGKTENAFIYWCGAVCASFKIKREWFIFDTVRFALINGSGKWYGKVYALSKKSHTTVTNT